MCGAPKLMRTVVTKQEKAEAVVVSVLTARCCPTAIILELISIEKVSVGYCHVASA